MKTEEPHLPSQEFLNAIDAALLPPDLPPGMREGLALLGEMLLEANDRFNLTAIRTPEGVAVQHFADSLAPLGREPSLEEARRAIDIGPGAGFPVLPLAMALPQIRWIGIESVAKKCNFIRMAAKELGLRNVRAENLRAEDAGRGDLRNTCDIVTARAVGPISALCEVGIPLLRTAGILMLWKTRAAEEELEDALDAIEKIGGEALDPIFYRLQEDRQERAIFRIAKVRATPASYPRRNGMPFRNPLA